MIAVRGCHEDSCRIQLSLGWCRCEESCGASSKRFCSNGNKYLVVFSAASGSARHGDPSLGPLTGGELKPMPPPLLGRPIRHNRESNAQGLKRFA